MAKGNMFMSTADGKVGNLVLYNRKGEQITRSYQSKVANPKSSAQMNQRGRFANAVKFYKRAVSNFFKFAYQDKKTTESDYNAFMRYNINRSPLLPKGVVDDPAWPALGAWIMSSGTLVNLPQPTFGTNNDVLIDNLFGDLAINDSTTIGQLSQALIDNNPGGVLAGDIITIVAIASPANDYTYDFSNLADSGQDNPPTWVILQFIVDSTDDTLAKDINRMVSGSLFKDFDGAQINFTITSGARFGCAIHTRVTDGKTLASYTTLQLNDTAQAIVAASKQTGNHNSALTTWGATSDAILQGGIAGTRSSIAKTVISTVNGSAAPLTFNLTTENGTSITVVGENLPNSEPLTSGTGAAEVSDFTLNALATQATFTLKPASVGDNGAYQVTYGGTVIVSGNVDVDNS